MPGNPDAVCSTTVKDVGCGVHITSYGGTWEDQDQNCISNGGTGSDMNCSEGIMDSNCGVPSNPSTTSPDECCGKKPTDSDEVCSRYDKDESCGSGNPDESCGTTSIQWLPDPQETDDNCGYVRADGKNDPDSVGSMAACPLGASDQIWFP